MRLLLLILFLSTSVAAQPSVSKVWVADNGDGTYRNPILHADYSDPDVIRVGDDFYLVASSFNAAPGLPILHSRDLVNWTIIGHAKLDNDTFWLRVRVEENAVCSFSYSVTGKLHSNGTAISCSSGQMDWGKDWYLRSRETGCVGNGVR